MLNIGLKGHSGGSFVASNGRESRICDWKNRVNLLEPIREHSASEEGYGALELADIETNNNATAVMVHEKEGIGEQGRRGTKKWILLLYTHG